jgi:hypothetical protein
MLRWLLLAAQMMLGDGWQGDACPCEPPPVTVQVLPGTQTGDEGVELIGVNFEAPAADPTQWYEELRRIEYEWKQGEQADPTQKESDAARRIRELLNQSEDLIQIEPYGQQTWPDQTQPIPFSLDLNGLYW